MDPVDLFYERYNRGDLDATMALFAPHALLDNCVLGQRFDGPSAIRGFLDDFAASPRTPSPPS